MMNALEARFAGVPSLIAPGMAERFRAALSSVMTAQRSAELLVARASSGDDFWFTDDDWRANYRPYVVEDGILQIPVKGVLLHDFPWAIGSWATGYAYIAKALERGLADANVRGIALTCDSFGGEVAGCFEVADKIYAARELKPIQAFAHEHAFSAGYAIASSASKITMSRTGGVGSIGVVTSHWDMSRALEDAGYKITFIFAGKHKVDGNSVQPLPDDVKARWQAQIDDCWTVFCEGVARNRGLSADAVRALEAECFTAKEAVANGLADAVAPFDDAIAQFNTDLSAVADANGDQPMTTTTAAAKEAANEQTAATTATARTEGEKTGATAERARIGAILGSAEAAGREDLAKHFAFETSMSAEDAGKALAKAPKQQAAAPDNRFETAMKTAGNPTVGAGAEPGGGDDVATTAAAIVAFMKPAK